MSERLGSGAAIKFFCIHETSRSVLGTPATFKELGNLQSKIKQITVFFKNLDVVECWQLKK